MTQLVFHLKFLAHLEQDDANVQIMHPLIFFLYTQQVQLKCASKIHTGFSALEKNRRQV